MFTWNKVAHRCWHSCIEPIKMLGGASAFGAGRAACCIWTALAGKADSSLIVGSAGNSAGRHSRDKVCLAAAGQVHTSQCFM